MRDPERIPVVLEKIKEYWVKHPDLRLGQIIGNLSAVVRNDVDPYYMEDEDLLQGLKAGMECPACRDRELIKGSMCLHCGREG